MMKMLGRNFSAVSEEEYRRELELLERMEEYRRELERRELEKDDTR
jgi:hypothetical protein